ncbi:cohesin domain-containing protein [Aggregatilinea lenta]|uniref:cohesin domain-containing protein n=1 Tax=Aggregatilinea lenta TaxID=913108 RepID=UPI000E5C40CD|nr:cohesin domain-containing protein [Aggregatilinea lenta]
MRNLLVLLFVVLVAGTVWAQENPTVEIVLSQPAAHQGDIITADIHVRGAVNVAGTDVGITVDSACLRILDRQPGGYLPTTDAEGAFVPFSELNEHDTRLAAALTDRSKIASGEGVFYTVQLEVTCAEATAPLTISYAKLSTYADPSAEAVSLISFSLDDGTLNAIDAELAVVPADQAITEPAAVVEGQPETSPTPAPEAGSEAESDQEQDDQTLLIILIALLIVLILVLVIVMLWLRRRSRGQSDSRDR